MNNLSDLKPYRLIPGRLYGIIFPNSNYPIMYAVFEKSTDKGYNFKPTKGNKPWALNRHLYPTKNTKDSPEDKKNFLMPKRYVFSLVDEPYKKPENGRE